jgi:hypothetical protein
MGSKQFAELDWRESNLRLTKPCCRRRIDAVRQFCSTGEAVKLHALANGVDGIYRRINDSATSERIHKIGALPAQCSDARRPTQSLTPALDL